MLPFHKYYVLDENQNPVAIQIPIAEFKLIEDLLENYGLAQLMDETEPEERLSGETAYAYYESMKNSSSVSGSHIEETSTGSFRD